MALFAGGALVIGMVSSRSVAVEVGLLAFSLYLLIGTGVVPSALAQRLQRSFSVRQPAHATFGSSVCIVLLGEGTTSDPGTHERAPTWIAGSRIAMAAALHRAAMAAGAKTQIIIAGERTLSDRSATHGSYARMLMNLGVGSTDVIQENDGLNTYQHARNIAGIVKANPAETVYLVTSALHMKRALLYFGAFGLRLEPFPSDHIHVPCQFLPVGYNFAVADIALHQYVGILRFYIYEMVGLNRSSSAK